MVQNLTYLSQMFSTFLSSLVSLVIITFLYHWASEVKKGLEKYQINDVMTKAAYTKLFLESDIPCKWW